MALEDIEAKIRAEGREQVEEIRAKAGKDIEKIKEHCNQELKQKCGKIDSDCEKKKAALRRSILSAARIKASNLVAMEKARAIAGVFEAARQEVLKLPEGDKKRIIARMLEDKSLFDEKPLVYVEEKYLKFLPKSDGFEVKKSSIGDFGIILSSRDGLITVDKRLNVLLEELSDKITPKLCEILFKET
ncbi:MAG: V-type ATP synthase subunit E [Candidatus Altiarchaeota archaeon]